MIKQPLPQVVVYLVVQVQDAEDHAGELKLLLGSPWASRCNGELVFDAAAALADIPRNEMPSGPCWVVGQGSRENQTLAGLRWPELRDLADLFDR